MLICAATSGLAIIFIIFNVKVIKLVHYMYLYVYVTHTDMYTDIQASLITWTPERWDKLFSISSKKNLMPQTQCGYNSSVNLGLKGLLAFRRITHLVHSSINNYIINIVLDITSHT